MTGTRVLSLARWLAQHGIVLIGSETGSCARRFWLTALSPTVPAPTDRSVAITAPADDTLIAKPDDQGRRQMPGRGLQDAARFCARRRGKGPFGAGETGVIFSTVLKCARRRRSLRAATNRSDGNETARCE